MNTKIGMVTTMGMKTNTSVNINNMNAGMSKNTVTRSDARARGRLSVLSLRALLVLYIYVLVKIILLKFHSLDLGFLWGQLLTGLQHPGLIAQQLHTGNLVPFWEISRSLRSLTDHTLLNLFGNVAIFIPLGILLGLMFKKEGMPGIKICICAFFLSLGLETAQLLFRIGQFDVDDILLNTAGGLLGFVIYRIHAGLMKPSPSVILVSEKERTP
ncbi:VanZ family protein [Paenibacillus medicaginis]|uniref:VanZ family protein n=1 Tax=Paenibacillus medicaginis TaxID=1470560 RepID=A0ABV5C8A0_9BACL